MKKKILVWETLGIVSGGQKMTLAVMDMLADEYDFHCLIPTEGPLSEELKKRNISYTLLGDQTMPTGVKGKSVIFRYAALTIKAIFAGLKAVRKEKADIIYAPGPAALPWSAIVGALKRRPVVWHLHHIFLDRMTKKLLNICSSWKVLKKIITVSDSVGEQITSPKGKEKINKIYNHVDFERFSSGDAQKIINEFNLDPQNETIIAHIGLLQPTKRQPFVLEMTADLQRRGLNVKTLFVGRARDEDTAYVEELKKLTENLGLTENVLFLGQRSDVPDILAASDLVVVPSTEGLSLAAMEAEAAGVPVIVCNNAGACELVEMSGGGCTFDSDNVTDAAEKTVAVLKDKEYYAEKGKEFAKSYSYENYKSNVLKLFKKIMEK